MGNIRERLMHTEVLNTEKEITPFGDERVIHSHIP